MTLTSIAFTPFRDRVVIRPTQPVTLTPTGIHIPEDAAKKETTGIVVAVGEGEPTADGFKPMCARLGDKVLYGKYAGTEVEIDGEKFVIVQDDQIIGTLPN